jgi:glycosyltransferase involved in cell wall biosynthesis
MTAPEHSPPAGPIPRISIVLPTYNGARYLEESLQSCSNQSLRDWELIIIDDCSTDATPEIIARWQARDSRIRGHRNPTNLKLPGSLNAGFALARCDYLTWTSDDNRYHPDALAAMCTHLDTHAEVDLVYTDYNYIDGDGTLIRPVTVGEPHELLLHNCVGACFLYRRAVQTALVSYAPDLFAAEDYDFWLRAATRFRLQALHNNLYDYRLHANTLTSTLSERVRKCKEESIRRALPKIDWAIPDQRSRAWMNLARLASERRDTAQCRRDVIAALQASPVTAVRAMWRGLLVDLFFGAKLAELLRRLRGGSSAPHNNP